MRSCLAIHQGPHFRASRGTAFAAIAGLHAGLLALAMHQRIEPAAPEVEVISISLLASPPSRSALRLPDVPTPRLEIPSKVQVPSPELEFQPVDEPIAEPAAASSPPVAALAAPAETRPPVPLQVSQAQYLRPPVLRYPPVALSARREGSVGLRVLVGQDGRVVEVDVERSSGYAPFDEAACSAVRAALFKPYTVNGEPRMVLVRIPIDFTLKRRGA